MAASTTLILGGGFGGIAAANVLRRAVGAEHEILIVDESADFHVGAGKTWVALGARSAAEISRPRAALLEPGVRLLGASVLRIDLAARSVTTSAGERSFDHLVIALGAALDPDAVPGLAAAAESFYTLAGAERLARVLEAFAGGEVVLLIPRAPFKCPPAPYEAAMLLADFFAARGLADRARLAVHTVEGQPMPTAGPEMGRFIRGLLEERGIAYYPARRALRVDSAARRIEFEGGTEARYDLLIAIPPHVAPRVVRESGLAGPAGWIPVDPGTLRVAGADHVYALGDVASLPLPGRWAPETALALPKAGVFAEAQGRVVARRIAAALAGREATATFDGQGYCFIETGGGRAARGDGAFFELPRPLMRASPPDARQLGAKQAWVADHLRPFGG